MLTGGLSIGAVYGLALAIGLATAFSIPSATSMLPHVMPRAQLAAANGVMMAVRQFSMFLGPLLAGVLIAVFGRRSGQRDGRGVVTDAPGLSVAFGLDALSFLVSAWALVPGACAGALSVGPRRSQCQFIGIHRRGSGAAPCVARPRHAFVFSLLGLPWRC